MIYLNVQLSFSKTCFVSIEISLSAAMCFQLNSLWLDPCILNWTLIVGAMFRFNWKLTCWSHVLFQLIVHLFQLKILLLGHLSFQLKSHFLDRCFIKLYILLLTHILFQMRVLLLELCFVCRYIFQLNSLVGGMSVLLRTIFLVPCFLQLFEPCIVSIESTLVQSKFVQMKALLMELYFVSIESFLIGAISVSVDSLLGGTIFYFIWKLCCCSQLLF